MVSVGLCAWLQVLLWTSSGLLCSVRPVHLLLFRKLEHSESQSFPGAWIRGFGPFNFYVCRCAEHRI